MKLGVWCAWGLALAPLGFTAVAGAAPAGANAARIVLRWKEVPGASAYELQIAKDSAFVEVVLQTRTTTAGYRWAELPAATHWWRVRSVDADGRASEWSPPRTIAVDSVVPELKRPADGVTLLCGANVEVELAASTLVKEYVLELASSANFQNAKEFRQNGPVFQLGQLGVGVWFTRVRALDLKGSVVGPGPVHSFSVRIGSPKVKPVADAVLGAAQIQLSWNEVSCARSWLLEATNDGKDRASLTANQPQSSFKATVAGDYRWRVAGVDEHGVAGEWSTESTFRVRLPVPQPKPEVVTSKAELSWTAVPTAITYRVEVSRVGQPDDPPLVANVAPTQWKTVDLEAGSYSWKVSAKDARGHTSAWSEPRLFERKAFAPLPVPKVHEGDDIIAAGAITVFEWDSVAKATKYQVELDGQPIAMLAGTRFETPALAEGLHQLRVRALEPPLRESPYSAPREVYAGMPPVARAKVEVVGREVHVTLFEKRGHLILGTPRFSVTRGTLGASVLHEDEWVMPWAAPEVGEDHLIIDERDFHLETPIEREPLTPFWVAFAAGGMFNGGAIASPTGMLAFGIRLPLFSRRVGVELRVGLLSAASKTPYAGVQYSASAWLVPISVLASWQQPLGSFVLSGSVGPSAVASSLSVNSASELTVVPAVHVAVALSRHLGPGRLAVELDFLYGRLDTPLARLNAGGFGVKVGYLFDFNL